MRSVLFGIGSAQLHGDGHWRKSIYLIGESGVCAFQRYLSATPLGNYQVSSSVSFCDFAFIVPARDVRNADLKLNAKPLYEPERKVGQSPTRFVQAGVSSANSGVANRLQQISPGYDTA